MSQTINVAHFVSGGWTTMESAARRANKGEFWDIRSKLVIASKSGIWAIEKAQSLEIPHEVVDPNNASSILVILMRNNIDVILQNGWLPLTSSEIVSTYRQASYNQHPGGLRRDRIDFGGKGMFGSRVTAAKILYELSRRKIGQYAYTESSIHRLTPELDDGELVSVKVLPITEDLDAFQEDNGLLAPDENIVLSPALQKLVSDVQWKLLVLEHENVADLMRTLWEWNVPRTHPVYDTFLNLDISRLNWAKLQARRLYPKG